MCVDAQTGVVCMERLACVCGRDSGEKETGVCVCVCVVTGGVGRDRRCVCVDRGVCVGTD